MDPDRLRKNYRAILDFNDKLEKCSQFQEKFEITAGVGHIWKVFVDEIRNVITIDTCALFLVNERTHAFALEAALPRGNEALCTRELETQIEAGMFSWVVNRRNPAIIPSLVFRDGRTLVMLPLTTLKRTVGVAMVLTPVEDSAITQENIKLLGMLAKQCSLVMENVMLYEHLRREHESLLKAQSQIVRAEKLAALGRLTAGASHEILNPLNILSGNIQLLQMDASLPERAARSLKIMSTQTDRIAQIVKSLAQLSSHNGRKSGRCDVNRVIEKVCSLAGHDCDCRNIRVVQRLEAELPHVWGDDEEVTQVLFNLLGNGKAAMPEGGTIEITTRVHEGPDEKNGDDDSVEIRFRDTGCGIPEEYMDKIFDPFFTTRETGSGTGLGLTLSYGIVERLGGTIQVKSRVHEGTEFIIRFPTEIKSLK